MKPFLFFSALLLMAQGCYQEPTVQHQIQVQQVLTKKDTGIVGNFRNPVLMYGSSFLDFFAMLKQVGNYEAMIKFTDKHSIQRHGREKIFRLYQNTNLNFTKKLKAIRKINDTTFVMNYSANIFSTNTITTVTVTIENDTCRLVLPDDLNKFLVSSN